MATTKQKCTHPNIDRITKASGQLIATRCRAQNCKKVIWQADGGHDAVSGEKGRAW